MAFFLNVYDIGVDVITDNEEFDLYLKDNYSLFIVKERTKTRITAKFSKDEGDKVKQGIGNLKRIGENFYIGKNEFCWLNEFGATIKVELNNDKITVKGFHYNLLEKISLEETLKNYMRCMRWFIHFPLFILLEKEQNKKIVHASAVSKNGEAFIFAGLNKVGKSSLARYLYENEGFNYISDNFLLTDGYRVFAFPELNRLSQESIEKLKINTKGLRYIYDKFHIPFDPEKIDMEVDVKKLFLVNNSSSFFLEKINTSEANIYLNAIHRYLKEFPEYTFFSIMEFYGYSQSSNRNYFSHHIDSYELSFPMDWNFNNIFKEIKKCI